MSKRLQGSSRAPRPEDLPDFCFKIGWPPDWQHDHGGLAYDAVIRAWLDEHAPLLDRRELRAEARRRRKEFQKAGGWGSGEAPGKTLVAADEQLLPLPPDEDVICRHYDLPADDPRRIAFFDGASEDEIRLHVLRPHTRAAHPRQWYATADIERAENGCVEEIRLGLPLEPLEPPRPAPVDPWTFREPDPRWVLPRAGGDPELAEATRAYYWGGMSSRDPVVQSQAAAVWRAAQERRSAVRRSGGRS